MASAECNAGAALPPDKYPRKNAWNRRGGRRPAEPSRRRLDARV